MDAPKIQQILLASEEFDSVRLYYKTNIYVALFVSLASLSISIVNREWFKTINIQFRHILFHTLGACGAMMICLTAWQPVILPPSIGGYSTGILDWLGPNGFLVGFCTTWICVGHLGMTLASAFLLQSYQLKIFGDRIAFFEWLNTGGNSSKFLNWSLVFNASFMTCFTFVFHMEILNLDSIPEFRRLLTEHPSCALIDMKGKTLLLLLLGLGLTLWSSETLCCVVANIQNYRAIHSTSKIVRATTLRTQMQLYRLFSLRLLVVCIFFYIPTGMLVLHVYQLVILPIPYFYYIGISIVCWLPPIQVMLNFLRFSMSKKLSVANVHPVKIEPRNSMKNGSTNSHITSVRNQRIRSIQ